MKTSSIPFTNLGSFYQKYGLNSAAERYYAKAMRINPDDSNAHLNLAIIYLQKKNTAAAKKEAELSLKADPDFTPGKRLLEFIKKGG